MELVHEAFEARKNQLRIHTWKPDRSKSISLAEVEPIDISPLLERHTPKVVRKGLDLEGSEEDFRDIGEKGDFYQTDLTFNPRAERNILNDT